MYNLYRYLLSYAKVGEDDVEELLDVDVTGDVTGDRQNDEPLVHVGT